MVGKTIMLPELTPELFNALFLHHYYSSSSQNGQSLHPTKHQIYTVLRNTGTRHNARIINDDSFDISSSRNTSCAFETTSSQHSAPHDSTTVDTDPPHNSSPSAPQTRHSPNDNTRLPSINQSSHAAEECSSRPRPSTPCESPPCQIQPAASPKRASINVGPEKAVAQLPSSQSSASVPKPSIYVDTVLHPEAECGRARRPSLHTLMVSVADRVDILQSEMVGVHAKLAQLSIEQADQMARSPNTSPSTLTCGTGESEITLTRIYSLVSKVHLILNPVAATPSSPDDAISPRSKSEHHEGSELDLHASVRQIKELLHNLASSGVHALEAHAVEILAVLEAQGKLFSQFIQADVPRLVKLLQGIQDGSFSRPPPVNASPSLREVAPEPTPKPIRQVSKGDGEVDQPRGSDGEGDGRSDERGREGQKSLIMRLPLPRDNPFNPANSTSSGPQPPSRTMMTDRQVSSQQSAASVSNTRASATAEVREQGEQQRNSLAPSTNPPRPSSLPMQSAITQAASSEQRLPKAPLRKRKRQRKVPKLQSSSLQQQSPSMASATSSPPTEQQPAIGHSHKPHLSPVLKGEGRLHTLPGLNPDGATFSAPLYPPLRSPSFGAGLSPSSTVPSRSFTRANSESNKFNRDLSASNTYRPSKLTTEAKESPRGTGDVRPQSSRGSGNAFQRLSHGWGLGGKE